VRCEVCGSEFKGRSGAKYCSGACRQKAYRERRKRNGVTHEAPSNDVVRRIGGMSSVTRDWLRKHKGPLLVCVVGFSKGEPMRIEGK
jgi:hypothetical protein